MRETREGTTYVGSICDYKDSELGRQRECPFPCAVTMSYCVPSVTNSTALVPEFEFNLGPLGW